MLNNHRIIITTRTGDPFARIPKTMLNDNRLSWKAKGILSFLLGQPPNWKPRINDLANRGTDGASAIRAAIKELRNLGYAKLLQVRDGGKISEWCLYVWDQPQFETEAPSTCEKLDVENQHLENRSLNKNEEIKNNSLSKERETRRAFSERSGELFCQQFAVAYKQQFGREYHATQEHADRRRVEKLFKLVKISPMQLLTLVKEAWKVKAFWCSKLHSIAVLVSHLNEINAEVANCERLTTHSAVTTSGRWRSEEELQISLVHLQ